MRNLKVIPEGEYGAGTVMIWDYGSYRNLRGAPDRGKKRRNMPDARCDPVKIKPDSAKTGRSMQEIAGQQE